MEKGKEEKKKRSGNNICMQVKQQMDDRSAGDTAISQVGRHPSAWPSAAPTN